MLQQGSLRLSLMQAICLEEVRFIDLHKAEMTRLRVVGKQQLFHHAIVYFLQMKAVVDFSKQIPKILMYIIWTLR